MTKTVTTKRQAIIPRAVRDLRGIAPGSKVLLRRADEKHPAFRFQRLRGHAGNGPNTNAVMALTRNGH